MTGKVGSRYVQWIILPWYDPYEFLLFIDFFFFGFYAVLKIYHLYGGGQRYCGRKQGSSWEKSSTIRSWLTNVIHTQDLLAITCKSTSTHPKAPPLPERTRMWIHPYRTRRRSGWRSKPALHAIRDFSRVSSSPVNAGSLSKHSWKCLSGTHGLVFSWTPPGFLPL